MKTLLSALFIAGSLYATAAGTKEKSVVNYELRRNFMAEFGNVENIDWHPAANNMTRANFIQDDEKITAWFDESSKYVAQTREIKPVELPKKLRTALNEKAPGAIVVSVVKMKSDDENAWFVETVAGNERKVWKGNTLGRLSRYYTKL